MKYPIIALVGLVATVAITAIAQDSAIPATTGTNSPSIVTASKDAAPGFQERSPRYRLRKGDSFDLDFALSPEFNQTVAVQPDGYVTLKGVGSILVEGQTVPELTETLKTLYAKMLHDPVITVALKDFDKPYFIAAGQVTKPGKYDLRGPLTVTEAVAIAGGFNEDAKHSQVVLFRPASNGMFETKLINVKKLLASRNLSEDVYLRPGDMLYVPQSAFSHFRRYIPTSSMGAYYNPAIY
ncbi:MAG: polysaccharide biosynthesis/export family protein [Terracidiphilus sp.]|jgi:polysaccharide export outer membrane protein